MLRHIFQKYTVFFEKSLVFLRKMQKPRRLLRGFAVWTGLEPATPCVTGRYSNQLNYQTKKDKNLLCGLDGTRTRDPLRDRQVF